MNKRILLRNLNKAADWVAAKQRDHDQAVNVMVGCFYILQQAGHHDMSGWLERKHTAKAGEELASSRMLWVVREPGVVRRCDPAVAREKLSELLGVLILLADAQRKRLESAMQQETRVRIERSAEVVEEP